MQNTSAAGVNLSDADSRIDLGQVDISSTGGEGVSLSNANQVGSFHISGGTIMDTDLAGVDLTNVSTGSINGVAIDNALRGSGIRLSGVGSFDGSATNDFVIDGVTISNVGDTDSTNGAPNGMELISDTQAVRVANSTITGGEGNGIEIRGMAIDIVNTTIDSPGSDGIHVGLSDGSIGDTYGAVNIINSTITGINQSESGVEISDGPVRIDATTISGGVGVALFGSGTIFNRVELDGLTMDVNNAGLLVSGTGGGAEVTVDNTTIRNTQGGSSDAFRLADNITIGGSGNTVESSVSTACDTTNAGTVTGSIAYNGGNSCP
ncbi:hypothetical protein KBTX_04287 [wastewater metagenome]|uniref:Right handed beta helix domain-containing protein n=2 Tax=unclassified sequences TaxID=12908 RepID=A0A5B8RH21_9ZZZZ|nr:hypothetical protein KBTEX_04287 [uncultured organism]